MQLNIFDTADDEAFENFDAVDSTSILGNQDGLDFDPSAVVDEEDACGGEGE